MILRQAEPSDLPAILDVFENSIRGLSRAEYDERQIDAWISKGMSNLSRWEKAISEQFFLIVEIDEEVAGFSSLKGAYIDLMYVSPKFSLRGAAKDMLHRLENVARINGEKMLTTDASMTIFHFFEKYGFVEVSRNEQILGGQILINVSMKKALNTDE